MGNTDQSYQLISTIANQVLPGCKIWLFGSRALGNNSTDSDYDLLIISSAILSEREKLQYKARLRKLLAKEKVDADLIIENDSELEDKKKSLGHIIHYIFQEAIAI